MKKDFPDIPKVAWVIFILVSCFALFLMFSDKGLLSLLAIIPGFFLFLPDHIHERRQFKKIDDLRQILHVSLEEMREVTHAAPCDLEKWERGKVFLDNEQMRLLEEYLDQKYRETFGHLH